MFLLLNKESTKYFEDGEGFVYKKVNENEKTVYYDCLNEPRCLVAARFYKRAKAVQMFGNHSEWCPPDSKMKMKIHFEEFLKRDVLDIENAAVSVLNLYKRAIEERYKSIWLPENHRTKFLPVLRRLRNYHKAKPEKSGCAEPKSKDAACSPIGPPNQIQVGALITPSSRSKTPIPLNRHSNCKATTSKDQSGAAMSSDMATSPMPNMDTRCEQNEATPTGTGNSIDGQMEASVISSSSILAPDSECLTKNKVFIHFIRMFEVVNYR